MRRLVSGATRAKIAPCCAAARNSGALMASSCGPVQAGSVSMPAAAAMARTVSMLSPEMTFSPTPCSRKACSVSWMSGRMRSLSVTRASGSASSVS